MNHYQGTKILELLDSATNYNNYLTNLVLQFGKNHPQFVDFGAGIGTFAIALAAHQKKILCIEPCEQQRAVISKQGLSCITSIDEAPDNSLPYVYSLNVLEHIQDDLLTIQTIFRKLRPGGTILIYVPAFNCLFSTFDQQVGHYRRYRRRQMIDLLNAAGFKVITAKYADSLGFIITGLFKLLRISPEHINEKSIILYDRIIFPLSRVLDGICHRWLGKNVWIVGTKGGNQT